MPSDPSATDPDTKLAKPIHQHRQTCFWRTDPITCASLLNVGFEEERRAK